MYRPEGAFADEEKISYLVELTGVFPFDRVMKEDLYKKLKENMIPSIAEYNPDYGDVVWFIPRKVVPKKTKNGKDYWILEVIDDTNSLTKVRCWGIGDHDMVHLNRPYMAKLDYNGKWGFSTRNLRRNFRILA